MLKNLKQLHVVCLASCLLNELKNHVWRTCRQGVMTSLLNSMTFLTLAIFSVYITHFKETQHIFPWVLVWRISWKFHELLTRSLLQARVNGSVT